MRSAFLLLSVLALATAKSYTNYHLLRATPQDETQLQTLKLLTTQDETLNVDFWIPPSTINRTCDLLVCPDTFHTISPIFKAVGLNVDVLNHNIQSAIDDEKSQSSGNGTSYSYMQNTNTYMRYSEIVNMLKSYDVYSHVTLKTYGVSYEKRELYVIWFNKAPGKKTILVEAGMHAREWIGVASVMKIIEKMATKHDSDNDVIKLLSLYNWAFVPVSNPDGYEYTHDHDRMWRKNRKPIKRCYGTDLNRNFDAAWSSEPESQALANLVRAASGTLIGFFSVHSYSQFILTPYAYTRRKPYDSPQLTKLAYEAARAMREIEGNVFTVGTPPEILYVASGGAYDWVKLKGHAKYSYVFELQPDHSTRNGFIIGSQHIKPSSNELFAALKTFAEGF